MLIILDTSCSFRAILVKEDFISDPVYHGWGMITTTTNSTASIMALGLVKWTVMLLDGSMFPFQVPCHLVADYTHHLLSLQDYCRYHKLPSNVDASQGYLCYALLPHGSIKSTPISTQ